MKDRELLIAEINEIQVKLQETNSLLYELTLQRLGWTDCMNGLRELLRRCQTEDAKEANESKQKEPMKQKDKK